MNFFLGTLFEILTAFRLILTGNEDANLHIKTHQPHFLLSWLMMIAGLLVYSLFLPALFSAEISRGYIPQESDYSAFKSANTLSLISIMLLGYLAVFAMMKVVSYTVSIRRYIISQNWLFLFQIILLLPLSLAALPDEGNDGSIILTLMIFIAVLFFLYRCMKITLEVNGSMAFLFILVLLFIEFMMDDAINKWFGLPASFTG